MAQWFLHSGLRPARRAAVPVTEWLVAPGPTWRRAGCLPASWAGVRLCLPQGSQPMEPAPRIPPPRAGTGPSPPSHVCVCVCGCVCVWRLREAGFSPCAEPNTLGGAAGQASCEGSAPFLPECPRAPGPALPTFEPGCQEKEGTGSAGVISLPDGSVCSQHCL